MVKVRGYGLHRVTETGSLSEIANAIVTPMSRRGGRCAAIVSNFAVQAWVM